MRNLQWIVGMVLLAGVAVAEAGSQEQVYSKLPIREVTIFKDGHAFVLHEGAVATDERGHVILDMLPQPITGTFWAYSADERATLSCVVSSRDEVMVDGPGVDFADLIRANQGRRVILRETGRSDSCEATILRLMEAQEATSNEAKPILVLIETAEGTKAMNVGKIESLTFLDSPQTTVQRKEQKDSLTLKLDWPQRQAAASAKVGMTYVQLGLRWIPSYRVEIDGQGKAVIKLQGTLVNELADLDDVTAHLVIGVPKFTFAETPDPISLQETVAALSRHFRPDSGSAYAFNNAIMSQRAILSNHAVPGGGYYQPAEPESTIDLGPELQGMQKNEDLFVFSLEHITLKKGQRMVLPIAEYTLEYEDVYTVDLQFAPPLEMRRNFNSDQHLQLARLFHAPKAMHKIRLDNQSAYPLTTAPATIFRGGRIVAQGMMTYTTIGGKGDLEVTTALEITVEHSDEQVNTTPNAVNWNGTSFSRVDMKGSVSLRNYGEKPAKLLVKRSVMGTMDTAESDGQVKQLGHGYEGYAFEGGVPFWWNWCSWPWWWYHFNSLGQAQWTLELEPGESVELPYTWHYFWN